MADCRADDGSILAMGSPKRTLLAGEISRPLGGNLRIAGLQRLVNLTLAPRIQSVNVMRDSAAEIIPPAFLLDVPHFEPNQAIVKEHKNHLCNPVCNLPHG